MSRYVRLIRRIELVELVLNMLITMGIGKQFETMVEVNHGQKGGVGTWEEMGWPGPIAWGVTWKHYIQLLIIKQFIRSKLLSRNSRIKYLQLLIIIELYYKTK